MDIRAPKLRDIFGGRRCKPSAVQVFTLGLKLLGYVCPMWSRCGFSPHHKLGNHYIRMLNAIRFFEIIDNALLPDFNGVASKCALLVSDMVFDNFRYSLKQCYRSVKTKNALVLLWTKFF